MSNENGKPPSWRVMWAIDIVAPTPLAAAQEAARIREAAPIYNVYPAEGPGVSVNLILGEINPLPTAGESQ